MGGAPPPAGPPQYGPPQYGAPVPGNQSVAAAQYANRNNAVEVEGAGRSKAQLIVGIDFVSTQFLIVLVLSNASQGTTFSGVAFAFATNTEAKEDIITEWPGAGSYTKQKVGNIIHWTEILADQMADSYGFVLRSISEGCGMGSRYR